MPAFSRKEYRDWLKAIAPRQIEFAKTQPGAGRLEKLVFDLASTCNMGCSYCFADRGMYGVQSPPRNNILSVPIANRIVTKVLEHCDFIGHIKFFGGEPLLASGAIAEVCKLTHQAASKGSLMRVPTFNVITNGTVFTNEIANTLQTNLVRMTISVDGPRDIHDAQRPFAGGRGTFDTISENIKKFHRAGCRLGVLEAVFTPLHIQFGYSMLGLYIALREKYSEIFEMIVVHPLDQPTLNSLPEGVTKDRYKVEMREQTRELYNYLLAEDTMSPQRLRFKQMLRMLTNTSRDENLCGVGSDIITVKPDGAVYSCYVFSEQQEFKYGSILSDEFWENYLSGATPSVMDVGSRFKHDACNRCDIQNVCTHCLSGMDAVEGMSKQLPDVNCHFNMGQIEGFFEMLQKSRESGHFDDICIAFENERMN